MPTASIPQQLTQAGSTMGTAAYMSPEQGRGRVLDQRTDLFSFGVVLYEMVTGTQPFVGQSTGEVLEAIFSKQPTAPVRLNPKIPADLERIIYKALEKDRNLRYQSAAEIRTDLQRFRRDTSVASSVASTPVEKDTAKVHSTKKISKLWIGIVAAVAAIALLGVFWFGRKPKTSAQAGPISIAVLPFVNMSPDKNQEYFSDGLAEQLLNDLARTPGLRVIARTSSFQFKGKTEDLRVIGQKLDVANILEGSVRKEGNKVRITAQLIQTSDGSHLWSDTYDRELNDVFAVQDDIARSVSGALKVTLLGEKPSFAKSQNAEAYNAYLQGRYLLDRRGKEDLQKAIGYFEQSLQFDPGYAPAWVGLASVHFRQTSSGHIPILEGQKKMRNELEKALRLDPSLAEAHSLLGRVKLNHDWDWMAADALFKKALELEPGNATAFRNAGTHAGALGRFDEAAELARKAIELDPLNQATYANLGNYYYSAGRLKESESVFRKVLELNPQYPGVRHRIGLIYLEQSNPKVALAEMERETEPIWRDMGLALCSFAAGKKTEADALLARYIEEYQSTAAFQIAEIYAYRGEPDKAFEWLERAYQLRDGGLAEMKGDPLLRNIEKDPRYTAFLKKMKLPMD